ncbi:MAG: hypothetical protein FWC00_00775 [Firmicutes bacterium]|nr:hypothetical protein [Bacillota bacterium]
MDKNIFERIRKHATKGIGIALLSATLVGCAVPKQIMPDRDKDCDPGTEEPKPDRLQERYDEQLEAIRAEAKEIRDQLQSFVDFKRDQSVADFETAEIVRAEIAVLVQLIDKQDTVANSTNLEDASIALGEVLSLTLLGKTNKELEKLSDEERLKLETTPEMKTVQILHSLVFVNNIEKRDFEQNDIDALFETAGALVPGALFPRDNIDEAIIIVHNAVAENIPGFMPPRFMPQELRMGLTGQIKSIARGQAVLDDKETERNMNNSLGGETAPKRTRSQIQKQFGLEL